MRNLWNYILSSFIFVLQSGLFVKSSRDVPSTLKTCNREDIDLDNCLKDAIQSGLIGMSLNGIPELGMKSIDPYIQKELVIEYKRNQISGKAILENLSTTGFGKTKVLAVRSNIRDDSFEMEVDLSTKKMFISGFLRGEGRLNAIVLKSKGNFNNTMHDLDFTWDIFGKPVIKNGEKYMKITKFIMRPEVGDMSVGLPEVSSSAEINRLAQYYINAYWRTIYRELLPFVQTIWEKICKSTSNKIFSKIPYDKLFPYDDD